MSATLDQFSGDPRFASDVAPEHSLEPPTGLRSEVREEAVRVAEYTAFPRRGGEPGLLIGFTRDLSPAGLCLGVDHAEAVGALLRVSLRQTDGSPDGTSVQRVVWCSSERDGRYWIGLEFLSGTGPGWHHRGRLARSNQLQGGTCGGPGEVAAGPRKTILRSPSLPGGADFPKRSEIAAPSPLA